MKNNYTEKQVEKMLNRLAQTAKPDDGFQKRLEIRLEEKFDQKFRKNNFWPAILRFKLRFASALIVITLTSATIYAYNSDSVVRGDLLYPLKTTAERVEGFFARTPERRTLYYEKMAKRREAEINNMREKDLYYSKTLEERDRLLELARQEEEQSVDKDSQEKIEYLRENLESNESETNRPLNKNGENSPIRETKDSTTIERDFLDHDRKKM